MACSITPGVIIMKSTQLIPLELKQENYPALFSYVPREIWQEILAYLKYGDVVKLSRVCKWTYNLVIQANLEFEIEKGIKLNFDELFSKQKNLQVKRREKQQQIEDNEVPAKFTEKFLPAARVNIDPSHSDQCVQVVGCEVIRMMILVAFLLMPGVAIATGLNYFLKNLDISDDARIGIDMAALGAFVVTSAASCRFFIKKCHDASDNVQKLTSEIEDLEAQESDLETARLLRRL